MTSSTLLSGRIFLNTSCRGELKFCVCKADLWADSILLGFAQECIHMRTVGVADSCYHAFVGNSGGHWACLAKSSE